jgi:hypothetical protein
VLPPRPKKPLATKIITNNIQLMCEVLLGYGGGRVKQIVLYGGRKTEIKIINVL